MPHHCQYARQQRFACNAPTPRAPAALAPALQPRWIDAAVHAALRPPGAAPTRCDAMAKSMTWRGQRDGGNSSSDSSSGTDSSSGNSNSTKGDSGNSSTSSSHGLLPASDGEVSCEARRRWLLSHGYNLYGNEYTAHGGRSDPRAAGPCANMLSVLQVRRASGYVALKSSVGANACVWVSVSGTMGAMHARQRTVVDGVSRGGLVAYDTPAE